MATDKILSKLLKYSGTDISLTDGKLICYPHVADSAAKSICKILNITSSSNNTELKRELRRSVVELTALLCKNKYSNPVLLRHKCTRADILTKHLTGVDKKLRVQGKESGFKKIKKHSELMEHFYAIGIQNCNLYKSSCLSVCPSLEIVNLGSALINFTSESSKMALTELLTNILDSPYKFDARTLEFLKNVWQSSDVTINSELYSRLSERLVGVLEASLLVSSSEVVEFDCEEYVSVDTKIEMVFKKHFPNSQSLLEMTANSSHLFTTIFFIMNDIFIASNFDCFIQKFIIYLLEEVKCRNVRENINNLYPYNLRNTVFLLDNHPETIKSNSLDFYNLVLDSMNDLKSGNVFEYVLLLSHNELWLPHCCPEQNKLD